MKTKRNIDLAHHFPNPTSLHHNCQKMKQQENCKFFPPLSYSCSFPSQYLRKKSKRKHIHLEASWSFIMFQDLSCSCLTKWVSSFQYLSPSFKSMFLTKTFPQKIHFPLLFSSNFPTQKCYTLQNQSCSLSPISPILKVLFQSFF